MYISNPYVLFTIYGLNDELLKEEFKDTLKGFKMTVCMCTRSSQYRPFLLHAAKCIYSLELQI